MKKITKLQYIPISFYHLVNTERNNKNDINILIKIKLLLKGFNSDKYKLYNLKNHTFKKYLSDYHRTKTQMINGPYSILLNDKQLFEVILKDENVVPKTYGEIDNKQLFLDGEKANIQTLIELLKRNKTIIIKKKTGGGGKGIFRVEYFNDEIIVNNSILSGADFNKFLSKIDNSLITEYLKQADYSKKIYPGTINTIRMLVMKDPSSQKSFLAIAVHKFGSKKTEPADNVWRGGLTSLVNLETGRLGKPAFHYENNSEIKWVNTHPDTSQCIEGVQLPNWNDIKESILTLTDKLENIQYVGWDVVITNDGFKIIEGNNHSDVNILQIHKPLLENEKIRTFYKYHDIF